MADSIPIARALGVKVILLPFFGKGALETQAEMDYVGDVLREVAPVAEKAGVILGLEDTISARDNVRIMERTKSPAVLTYYDVGNSTKNGFDVVEEIRWLGADRICEVHLKDNPHYLGQGTIDFPAVVDALADIGFSQWAQLETSSPSGSVEKDMATNLAYIRGAHRAPAGRLILRLRPRYASLPKVLGLFLRGASCTCRCAALQGMDRRRSTWPTRSARSTRSSGTRRRRRRRRGSTPRSFPTRASTASLRCRANRRAGRPAR